MRVAVTTSADSADRFAAPLIRNGFDVELLPCIAVEPAIEATLDEVRDMAGSVDWIVVTSARAVEVVWPYGGMPPTPAAVVGSATGEAVARAGGCPVLVGDTGSMSLVEQLAGVAAGRTVLFPKASGASPAVGDILNDAGARVIAVTVYTTTPVPPPSEPPVDVALFASPSAVHGWVGSRSLRDVVRAALGSTTAAALTAVGYSADVIAPRPRAAALVEALVEYAQERRST